MNNNNLKLIHRLKPIEEKNIFDILLTITPPLSSPSSSPSTSTSSRPSLNINRFERIERAPIDICCIIDISGSMGNEAISKDIEASNLTILDIVKHAVKTVISCLNENDRLSIVSYSSTARIELDLIYIHDKGKEDALNALNKLKPEGSTNIWDGLLKGMNVMNNGLSNRNSAIFLFTDGSPNVLPSKGHIPSMRDYKDSHGGIYPATISTFGFGYTMKSDLLNEIALEGGGSYAFIPDSGFVGTIFVNALANQFSSFAKQATLSIELTNGAKIVAESLTTACTSAILSSWGVTLPIGNLHYDQRRDFTFIIDMSNFDQTQTSFIEVTLQYQLFNSSNIEKIYCENLPNFSTGLDLLYLEYNLFRASLLELLLLPPPNNPSPSTVTTITTTNTTTTTTTAPPTRIFNNINNDIHDIDEITSNSPVIVSLPEFTVTYHQPDEKLLFFEDLANRMSSWCSRVESRYSDISQEEVQKLKDYVEGLYLDLTGEINLACSDSANYEKWGKHFLPSIRRAHQLQQCNNFKDPGVQFYGGSLFNLLRDHAEDMFCTLPAPTPTMWYYNTPGFHSARSPDSNNSPIVNSYDMSAYMNASAGCISGNCDILLSNGNIKLMKDVMKGDKVCCNLSYNNPNQRKYEAIVECVVRTRCENKVEMVQFPSGLIATPWHPVYLTNQNDNNQHQEKQEQNEWIFPFEYIGKSQLLSEEYVYNLVLGSMTLINDENNDDKNEINKRGQSFIVNGMECISLAHGIKNDKVAEHEFYGSEKVVESLQSLVGIDSYFKTGLVTMNNSQIVRDPITGLVCNYK